MKVKSYKNTLLTDPDGVRLGSCLPLFTYLWYRNQIMSKTELYSRSLLVWQILNAPPQNQGKSQQDNTKSKNILLPVVHCLH